MCTNRLLIQLNRYLWIAFLLNKVVDKNLRSIDWITFLFIVVFLSRIWVKDGPIAVLLPSRGLLSMVKRAMMIESMSIWIVDPTNGKPTAYQTISLNEVTSYSFWVIFYNISLFYVQVTRIIKSHRPGNEWRSSIQFEELIFFLLPIHSICLLRQKSLQNADVSAGWP